MNTLLRKHLLKLIAAAPTHESIPNVIKHMGQFIVVERKTSTNTNTNPTPYVAYTCASGIWYFDANAFYNKRAEWQKLLNDAYAAATINTTKPFYLLKAKLDAEKYTTVPV
ncbi:hypothetical protein [Moraxella marmotae]|uniref:hypothetical protein n=1 Tax=Moraxella marmotae TaxID=3344520 RepID=UPI0035F3FD25